MIVTNIIEITDLEIVTLLTTTEVTDPSLLTIIGGTPTGGGDLPLLVSVETAISIVTTLKTI